ncbi:hypothetical protein [Hyphomicrobium sp. CS1BSMeth3]|uniref:lipase/acyltransferase domain-containing protein n=1 Tax=Hyphomicrobium sp. CS1BSMeth3 TaxID=1892844 RepID=UPI0009311335|nr:hypothetical protein [Hyphomicrobium sp. CS1BSMeth3]
MERFGILGPLKVGLYSGLVTHLEKIGYVASGQHRNLFIFPYDWRRSNFQTAEAFARFVAETPGLVGNDFDIIAHSMGGLVALIYAHKFDSPSASEACKPAKTCRIKTVITLGTPYLGSMNAVATPVDGWGWVSRQISGGSDTISRTVLSWPSFYELLPSYSGCCDAFGAEGLLRFGGFSTLSYASAAGAPAQSLIEKALERRRDIARLSELGWPKYLDERSPQCDDKRRRDRVYMFAGDRTDTRSVAIRAGRDLKYQERRGDGTVLVRSASLNSVERSWTSFAEHSTIFDDNNVRTKIEQVLKRCAWTDADFKAEEPTMHFTKESGEEIVASVLSTSARIEQVVLPSGSNALNLVGEVSVAVLDPVVPPDARYQVRLDGHVIADGDLGQPVFSDEGGVMRYRFQRNGVVVSGAGLVEAVVHFQRGPSAKDHAIAP